MIWRQCCDSDLLWTLQVNLSFQYQTNSFFFGFNSKKGNSYFLSGKQQTDLLTKRGLGFKVYLLLVSMRSSSSPGYLHRGSRTIKSSNPLTVNEGHHLTVTGMLFWGDLCLFCDVSIINGCSLFLCDSDLCFTKHLKSNIMIQGGQVDQSITLTVI